MIDTLLIPRLGIRLRILLLIYLSKSMKEAVFFDPLIALLKWQLMLHISLCDICGAEDARRHVYIFLKNLSPKVMIVVGDTVVIVDR